MCAYWVTPYLERIAWVDGTLIYCRKCDSKRAMTATQGGMLRDERGHEVHPAQAVSTGELAR